MADKKIFELLGGKRRKAQTRESIRFPDVWPWQDGARKGIYKTWRDIASAILNMDNGSYRLLEVMPFVLEWGVGYTLLTDEAIAEEAGRCCLKTVSREIAFYRESGIIQTSELWLENDAGKKIRTRKIVLSVPKDLRGIRL